MADNLSRAEQALHAEDRAEALEALLAAWRHCRAPELEEVIAVVSKDAARGFAPLTEDRDGYDAAWTAREKAGNPGELHHLLPGLQADPRGGIPLRLRKLIDRGADPRLGAALLEVIDEPPVTASSNFPMWTTLFAALPSMADARASKRLQARAKKKGGESKFWPKLTAWITTALPKLAAPGKLPPEDSKRVAQLAKTAAALAKGAAPEPKTTRLRAAAEVPVLKTLEEGTRSPLAALLTVWGSTRAPEVAAQIDRLGHALSAVPIDGKKHAEWMKLGKRGAPEQVTALLDALVTGKLADAEERMAVMLGWAPDPRVAQKMVLLINSSIGARPVLWKLCYELLVVHADPRVRKDVRARVTHLETAALFDRPRAEGPHARRNAEPFFTACDKARTLQPAERAALKKYEALGHAAKAEVSSEDALLRAIADDYASDAPRAVYADYLSERGDPRGEHLSLALAAEKPGAKLKGKVAASFKTNLQALLGPLGPLKAFAMEFERGLLHTFEARDDRISWAPGPALEQLLSDLRWAQLHTLKFWGWNRKTPGLVQILERAPLHALRRLEAARLSDIVAITHRDFPWKLSRVQLSQWGDETGYGDWGATGPLASLRELEVGGFELPPASVLKAPVLQHVETLRLGHKDYGGWSDPHGWLTEPLVAGKRLELRCAGIGFTATAGRDVDFEVDARVTAGHEDFHRTLASLKKLTRDAIGKLQWKSASASAEVNAQLEAVFSPLGGVRL